MRTATVFTLLALLIAGCAQAEKSKVENSARWTHTVTHDEPYYLTGPQQGRPPDGSFVAGARVRLLEDGGSYARVQSDSGVTAWTSRGALAPIPTDRPHYR